MARLRVRKANEMDAGALQQAISLKQAEVGNKLSALKSEITRNPLAEIAEKKPLVVAGSALALGILGALIWRGLSSDRSHYKAKEELAAEVTRLLHERYSDRLVPPTPDEVAETIRNVESPAVPVVGVRSGTRMGAFLGSFLGSIARSVVREVLASFLTLLSQKTGAEQN